MANKQTNEPDVKAQERAENCNYHYIVGIGASAGGLEALQKLLTALPADTGFPYVIIQHLSPDYKSLLGEILSKYTAMPVIQVEDGMEVQPDCVYVIQPGKNMRIANGKLHLIAQREKELNLPIDMFFRSLAEEAGPRAIAVVLSGTGSDGTNGIKSIKENDGMIIVQDLESSKFDGMPRSAIRTGLVDAQIPPEEIALELQHISVAANNHTASLKSEKEIDDELMKKVYIILKKLSNINFTHYKQTTIMRRIERRMMLTHKEDLKAYVDYLYASPEEVKTLSKEVLIGVTSFFRDPDYFQCLKEKAIQNILLHSTQEEPVRVWVTGCSTGEEAYSIAILFCEEMEVLKLKRTVKIFATDLDMESISIAGKGVYSDNIIDTVSPARLSRYFTRRNNTYVVSRDIRKMIVFSPHNVFQDPPFGRLDLISCRNMLIYFQPVLQNDLFAIFHASLKDGGYLFLGKSEAIGMFTEAFPVVDAAAKIFSHRSRVKIPGAKTIPYLQTTYLDDEFPAEADTPYVRRTVPGELGAAELGAIDTELLEQFMPACLVVNAKNELVHSYGENSNYVHLAVGRFSNGLYDILTEGLKIPVSTLLKEAREKKAKVQYKDIRFNGEREQAAINLTAMPVSDKAAEGEGFYALVFSELSQRGEAQNAIPYDIDRVASQRITDLEQNLGDVQSKLDHSIAEQECVNEELQAANEELLTANEELQSSNEELQSVNEELYTVNSEYQMKLTELADLNDDIANFLSSTLIGIIFVDNKLNIRRYTDYVTKEFSVMDHDIGRSLKFISYHFPTVDISEICDNVLKTLVPDEREVSTGKGKVFFMRVAPYRTTENKILGCVITLVDVTTQKQGLVQLQTTEEKLTIAQQISAAKSDFLSRIAHEIRTPMGALVGLTKQAKQKLDNKEELALDLDKMSETADYMASIVTDISEAANSERRAGDSVREPFPLRSLIDNVESIIKYRAEDAGLTFETSLPDDFAPVYVGNKTAIQQVLINLLNNSIKHTPRGGAVTLKTFEAEDSNEHAASLRFVIADNGIGIDKAFLPDLFKPFSDEKAEDAEEPANMGLGLSIAYNLIQSMDGEVAVKSEPGKGSTFTVRLKLDRFDAAAHAARLAQADAAHPVSLAGRHVLMAEDNALNRTILGSMLANEGVTYDEAVNGEDVVNLFLKAPENTYDCILMDMRMPKLDGIRATLVIRSSNKGDATSIPIIGVSANGFADDIKQAYLAGVNSYIPKPIDRDDLLSAMGKLLK
ncbi:MAG: chemotaxis protein CheB [Eubacteriales bacterium]|nr:chemotaxis protein CheB [Eubacteriales bacterium]